MSRKIIILSLIAVLALFFGIKLNNFIIGQKILGDYTSINSAYLKIKPVKRDIRHGIAVASLYSSLAGIKFNIPKTDTFKTFKLREVYRAFYFADSSKLKVFKDSINMDFIQILSSIKHSNNNIIGNYIRGNKVTSNFDLLLLTYNKTPTNISFFNLSKENTIIQYTFLKLKDLCARSGEEKAFYYFNLKNIKGFQYGSPKPRWITQVDIYTNKGEKYLLVFTGFKQEQIDYIIASINDSLQ